MQSLQFLSIILEAVIVLIALSLAISKKKMYGYGFALTFAIYVYYDLSKLMEWSWLSQWLFPLFFVATVSALKNNR